MFADATAIRHINAAMDFITLNQLNVNYTVLSQLHDSVFGTMTKAGGGQEWYHQDTDRATEASSSDYHSTVPESLATRMFW